MSEIREGEGLTAFTIRRIRNEIIEECLRAVLSEHLLDPTDSSDDIAYDNAIRDAANAVRVLIDK